MKIYRLENGKYLGVSYFTNVQNLKWLKENILSVFEDKSPVLICPRLIVDPFQIIVAANNAYLSHENGSMITKALATEILFNLSSTKNINKALNDMGANIEDNDMIVALVSTFSNVPEMEIFHKKCIEGCETNLSEYAKNIDENFIKSYYGINEKESNNSNLLDSIVTRIACKPLI